IPEDLLVEFCRRRRRNHQKHTFQVFRPKAAPLPSNLAPASPPTNLGRRFPSHHPHFGGGLPEGPHLWLRPPVGRHSLSRRSTPHQQQGIAALPALKRTETVSFALFASCCPVENPISCCFERPPILEPFGKPQRPISSDFSFYGTVVRDGRTTDLDGRRARCLHLPQLRLFSTSAILYCAGHGDAVRNCRMPK